VGVKKNETKPKLSVQERITANPPKKIEGKVARLISKQLETVMGRGRIRQNQANMNSHFLPEAASQLSQPPTTPPCPAR
jgi:hypothetical protein